MTVYFSLSFSHNFELKEKISYLSFSEEITKIKAVDKKSENQWINQTKILIKFFYVSFDKITENHYQ